MTFSVTLSLNIVEREGGQLRACVLSVMRSVIPGNGLHCKL